MKKIKVPDHKKILGLLGSDSFGVFVLITTKMSPNGPQK